MACLYTYKGENLEYDELVALLSNDLSGLHDILYSLNDNRQELIANRIQEIIDSNKRKAGSGNFEKEFSSSSNFMTGGVELNVPSGDYSLQSFIDSPIYIDNQGNVIIIPYSMEELAEKRKEEAIERLMRDDNLSKTEAYEEAEKEVKTLLQNYEIIKKDARDFHKIILKMRRDMPAAEMKKLVQGTSFEYLTDLLEGDIDGRSVYQDIVSSVWYNNGKHSRELGDDSKPKVFKNIKLSAELTNAPGKIHAHIDFLAVKPDGFIEVFLVKSSHDPYYKWDRAKKEKYQHEMALIARMLQHNGVNVKDIRFNVIPAVFTYNQDHTKITDISIQPVECFSHRNDAFVMYDAFAHASKFIDPKIDDVHIESNSIDKVNKHLNAFIPEGNVKAQGIEQTIEEYINDNWHRWIQGEQPDSGYNLTIDEKTYHIKDTKLKSENNEVVELIKQLQLTKKRDLSAPNIIQKLLEGRRTYGAPGLNSAELNELFSPYFEHTEYTIKGKTKYDYTWEIVKSEDLADCNIIMFKNKNSHQLDIITLSEINSKKKYSYNGQTNILCHHLNDMDAQDNQGNSLIEATYGNINAMRTMFLLNEILPTLGDDIKLGNISIVGGIGSRLTTSTNPISLILPNFVKACNIINDVDKDIDLKNNFAEAKSIEPVESLINEYIKIMHETSNFDKSQLSQLKSLVKGSDTSGMQYLNDGLVRESLASAETTAIKIERLQELIQNLQKIITDKGERVSPDNLIKISKSHHIKDIKNGAKLLIQALITLDRLKGNIKIVDSELSELDRLIVRPQDRSNAQIRLVSKLLQDAIHSTAYRLDAEISPFIQDCLDYYQEIGYGKGRNFILGDQVNYFDRLFQEGLEHDLCFKNPYNTNNDLTDVERKFLKKVLFYINKVRYGQNSLKSDEEMLRFIGNNPSYLNVPLEKASKTTRRVKSWQNPIEYAQELSRRVGEYCKDPKRYFREMYEGILSKEEQEQVSNDIEDLQAYNKFKVSDFNGNIRKNMLQDYGKDYFETNVQNLVIDYIHKALQEEEMNKMLVQTKGILTYLKLKNTSELSEDEKRRQSEVITDYLKTSIFGVSTMRPETQEIEARIKPFRQMVTKAYIMLSPVAAVRDIIGGFRSNLVRSLTKYRTDIDPKDVMWAYQYVLKKGSASTLTIDLLDKFNTKYLISNINVEQQQEGYKSDTQGIASNNWAYATLRKPDFLNRMVLFMAKLRHDGSHKAYSVENGILKYDWRKDDRFSLLATNNKQDPEAYNKQKSLYLSQIIAYNKEHTDNQLPVALTTNLPDGYTLNQIEEIKHLGNTIYGAYSASEKAGYEQMFLGHQFAVFSTWMNGIWDVYFGKRRVSSYETQKIHKENDFGNKLYIDENGNITTTITETPYLEDIPLIVQGVFNTLKDMGVLLLFHKGNKWEAFKEQILNNKVQKRNLLRGLSDLLIFLFLKFLVMNALDDEYKEHKKNADGQDIITNALTEILYKGYGSSYEEFRGPFPIFDYVINNTKPAAFQWQQKFLNDTGRMLFGDKTLGEYIVGMQALPRSMQDTYRMYMRDKNKPTEE